MIANVIKKNLESYFKTMNKLNNILNIILIT